MHHMERITTALHKGKAIIQIDFDGCKPGAFAPVIADAQRLIAASPKGSVLALTCLENVRFDPSTVVEMQRFVSAAMPFLPPRTPIRGCPTPASSCCARRPTPAGPRGRATAARAPIRGAAAEPPTSLRPAPTGWCGGGRAG